MNKNLTYECDPLTYKIVKSEKKYSFWLHAADPFTRRFKRIKSWNSTLEHLHEILHALTSDVNVINYITDTYRINESITEVESFSHVYVGEGIGQKEELLLIVNRTNLKHIKNMIALEDHVKRLLFVTDRLREAEQLSNMEATARYRLVKSCVATLMNATYYYDMPLPEGTVLFNIRKLKNASQTYFECITRNGGFHCNTHNLSTDIFYSLFQISKELTGAGNMRASSWMLKFQGEQVTIGTLRERMHTKINSHDLSKSEQ